MAITITHAEQAARQRRAANLLGRLLTTFPNLPVIAWTVGPAGSALVGRCLGPGDSATYRIDFATWCAVLGAQPRPDHTIGGVTRLQAFIDDLDGVHIHMVADIFDGDAMEASHGTR
jgi:hypothetical protein